MARPLPAWLFRHFLNWWPPYLGTRIRVVGLAADWHWVRIELRPGLRNRNYFGTHFGGSLYSMVDPFYVLMLVHVLGRDYLVWDQAAEIDFVKPGRGVVSAEIRLDPAEIERIRRATASGEKVLPEYSIDIRDAGGEVVARVRKRLYIRLKKRARPGTSDAGPAGAAA